MPFANLLKVSENLGFQIHFWEDGGVPQGSSKMKIYGNAGTKNFAIFNPEKLSIHGTNFHLLLWATILGNSMSSTFWTFIMEKLDFQEMGIKNTQYAHDHEDIHHTLPSLQANARMDI